MVRGLAIMFGATLALAAVATAATHNTEATGPITVVLHEEHHSGQHGMAVLTSRGPKSFTVKITLTRGKKFPGPYPNDHIHDVSCRSYDKIKNVDAQYGTVVVPLSPIPSSLIAVTKVNESLSKVTTGHYSINIHANDGVYTTVVCGDIPKR